MYKHTIGSTAYGYLQINELQGMVIQINLWFSLAKYMFNNKAHIILYFVFLCMKQYNIGI